MIEKKKLIQREKPCPTCPYSKSTPSGIWHKSEYEKLPLYDLDMIGQLREKRLAPFCCHYSRFDGTDTLCQGWLDVHQPDNLLAMKLNHTRVPDDFNPYPSGVPVYKSGEEAYIAGMRDYKEPATDADKSIKILRKLRERKLKSEERDKKKS